MQATLLAWQHNQKNGVRVAEKLNLNYSSGTAEHYLENTPGTAFLSSVGKMAIAGKSGNLTDMEKDYLGRVRYIS